MNEYPIKAFKENVIYTKNNEAWAYYKINANTAGLNNVEKLSQLKYNLNKMVWQLQAFKEIDYKIIPVPLNVSKIIDSISAQYEGQYAEIGKHYAARAKDILLEEVGNAVEYKFYIGVKLKEVDPDEGKFFGDIAKSFRGINRTIKLLTGVKGNSIDAEIINQFKNSEEEAFSVIGSYLETYRLNEADIRYLLRYQFVRGQGKPENEKSLYSLTEGIFDQKEYGYLKIEQLESEGFVSFIPVSEFPIDMVNTAWANIFQTFSFPVEMNIRTVYEGKEKDWKDTNKIKKRFKEQDAQLVEANEDEDTLITHGRQLLFELENDIKNQNKPLLRTHTHFVVWGASKEECRERVNIVKRFFADASTEIVQPLSDQLILFHQSIPTADIKANDWEQLLTPESFAEGLFSLTRKTGNTAGFYLGKDISLPGESKETSKHLVFYHPFVARQGIKGSKYSSPHCTISGPTGMGKSFLLKDIILNAIFFGAKILITDPKNEIEKQFRAIGSGQDAFSHIVQSFNYITFSADKNDAGKLDPLTFLDGEESKDTAVSILEYLSEVQSTERNAKTAISEAVRKVIQTEKEPGLLKVVKLLQESQDKEVQNVGNFLYEIGTNGIAKLLFSDGNVSGISLNKQVNVLQIQNLTLPEDGEKPATRDEHIAVALMIPLAKFATKFARNSEEKKITIFEEAWMLTNTGQGHKLIKEMLRTGRSLQSAVYIITQSISDYNRADIKENIGTKFAFKAKTAEEAGHIIEYLGLEDNKANRDMLKNLSEGQCIMEDIFGRTAKIQTDVLFNEWVKAFDTKEDKKNIAQLEEAFIL